MQKSRLFALSLALTVAVTVAHAQVPDLAPAPGQPAATPSAPAKPSSRRSLQAKPGATPATAPDAGTQPFPKQYIHSVTFKGAEPYTPAEILPLAGLKTGQLLEPDTLQLAVQRLFDSGLFADAQAANDGDTGMRDVTFTLKPVPAAELLHASFANFVWLSDRDLQGGIRRLVPIFHTGLPDPRQSPVSKSVCDDMQAGLVKLLQGRGVVATVAYQVVPANQFHPYISVEFRIVDPVVRLDSAEITNYPNSLIDAINTAVTTAKAEPYNEGTAGITIEDLLLLPARDVGYVNAKLVQEQRFHRTLAHEVTVQYSAQLLVGPLFHIRDIRFESTSVYDSSDYGRDRKVQPGDVATPAALLAARKPIVAAYYAQGYLDASIDQKITFDEPHGVLDLTLSVVPGGIYRVGKLIVNGLPPDARAEFDSAWKLNPGVVYSDRYVSGFAARNASLPKLSAYTYTYHVEGKRAAHTVELTLNFRPKGTSK